MYISRNKQTVKKHAISSRIWPFQCGVDVYQKNALSISSRCCQFILLTSIPYIFFRDVAGRLENSWICLVSPRFFRRRGGENRDTTELVFQTEFRSFTSSGDRSSSSPSTSFSSSPRPSSHCWPSKKYSSRTRSLHSIIPCIYFPRFFHAREILRETLRSYNCSCNICDHAAAQYKSLTKEKINFFFHISSLREDLIFLKIRLDPAFYHV